MGAAMTTATVLSGPERRRRWTAAEKLRLVEETLAPGASVAEVARRHDVHANLLHVWRKQARTGVLAGAVEGKARSGQGAGFSAVWIAREPPILPAAVAPAGSGVIEMEFANGSRLRVSGAVDPAIVGAALAVLASAGRRR
jgi:transposase